MFASATLTASLALLGSLCRVTATGPLPTQIKNLVTFGDSYTDVVSSPVVRLACTETEMNTNRWSLETPG